MTTCPSDGALRSYLADTLNRSDSDGVDAHVEACRACQAALGRLTEEAAPDIDIGSQRIIRLGSGDDASLLPLKGRLNESDTRNGLSMLRLRPVFEPPRIDGDLGSIGAYRLQSVVGRGGTAIVFRGVSLDRGDVAIKVLRPELRDRENTMRFLRGARSAVAIGNRHVVEIVSVEDPTDGTPYLVMEYVDGGTLDDRIRREGKLAAREAAEIVRQVSEGLDAAHRRDLVHRDVKSTNILLDRSGQLAKIADFGLARNFRLPAEITRHGEVSGTPEFMSREQILAPERVDARTDIYGLGIVLYHAMTGETPFRGTLLGVLRQVLDDEPLSPRRRNDAIPRELETICLKCLEKDQRRRYASASALAEDLRSFLDGKPIRARRPGITRQAGRWARRHPAWTAAFVVGAITISSSGLILGSINVANARSETRLAHKLQRAAEAQAAAEHRESETQRREAGAQRREALLLQMQRIKLTYLREDWSRDLWGLARRVATGSPAGDPRIQAEVATCLVGLDAHKVKSFSFPGTGVAFDPLGRQLMMSGSSSTTQGSDQPIQTWDTTTDELRPSEIRGEGVFGFRSDGTRLFLTVPRAQPSIANLWDTSKVRLLGTFKPQVEGRSKIRAWTMTPDGSMVASSAIRLDADGEPAEPSTIAVWEAASGREVFRTTALRVTDVALAPDASLLAAGHEDGQITVRSLPRGELIATLKADRNVIQSLTFGRDPFSRIGPRSRGRDWLLATGDAGGGVIIWDLRSQIPRSICHGSKGSSEILAMAFSPDGMTLASTGRGLVKLWDIASGQFLLEIGAGNYVTALAFSPDGKRLAVGSLAAFGEPESLIVWEIEPGRGIDSLRGLLRPVFAPIFSPDGRLVAALADDWRVGIWDRNARRLLHVLEVTPGHHSDNAALAFSPDGRLLAFSGGHEASLWDAVTGEPIKTWRLFEGLGDRLAFPELNRLLLFRTETETGEVGPFTGFPADRFPRVCRVRDLLGGEPLKPLAEIKDCNIHVFSSDCSRDGKYYAIEGLEGSPNRRSRVANLYEGPTGKKLGPLPTETPVDFPGAELDFDASGLILNFRCSSSNRTLFLEIPSRAVVREFGRHPLCLAPHARRWLMGVGRTADQPSLLALHAQDRRATLVRFVLDSDIGKPQFSPDGLHVIWGNASGVVTAVDLVEVNRRLGELGLGW